MDAPRSLVTTQLHPEVARAARHVPRYDYAQPEAVRVSMRRAVAVSEASGFWRRNHPDVTWSDRMVPGSRVPVRIYEPKGRQSGSILFIHGGGFLVGDLDMEHPRCLEMCRGTGRRIVSVNYRLAPEHPFPAAFEDCSDALSWVMLEAEQDAEHVAVMGISAGGALSAGMNLMRRDSALPLPCIQLLIYPVLDDRLSTPSMREYRDTPAWDAVSAKHSWRHYLGTNSASCYAAPARAQRLEGLPRTYIMAADLDPLRDEALDFGHRLIQSGVPTDVQHWPGTFHGFDVLSSGPMAASAREEHYAALRGALGGAAVGD